jgi:hypothetical protein
MRARGGGSGQFTAQVGIERTEAITLARPLGQAK